MKHPTVGPLRVAVLIGLVSCNTDNDLSLPAPPAGYPTAYATADCAPADGPAVRLYLTTEPTELLPPATPFIDVAIWQGVGSISNRRIELAAASSNGTARRCDGAGACEQAATAVMHFRPIGADTTVTGTVTLTFPGGSTVAGGFNAAWRSTTMLCG